ncbi:PREDICTED: titin homolog [Nicrophorus vespilloides]|uniref:Titin homolog n=1 Tax=Nicrophorus vespilloides TaxID=110193 RepID=A0ABM1N7X6_NICVS|nr:PREDICTED: titin homolog [Nicrophorus vespilloides]XP_017782926.1 PREDICTED: titin homolog [Nicrophorus vespilloides]
MVNNEMSEELEAGEGSVGEESSSNVLQSAADLKAPSPVLAKETMAESQPLNEDEDAESVRLSPTSLFCSLPLNRDVQSIIDTFPKTEAERAAAGGKKTRKIPCLYCDRTFVADNLRQKHIERCHSIKQARRSSSRIQQTSTTSTSCLFCHKLVSTDQELEDLFDHLATEHADKYFGCLRCKERFTQLTHLEEHNEEAHGIKREIKVQSFEEPSDLTVSTGSAIIDSVIKTRHKSKIKLEPEASDNKQIVKKLSPSPSSSSSSTSKVALSQKDLRGKRIALKSTKLGIKRSTRLQNKVIPAKPKKKPKEKPAEEPKPEPKVPPNENPYPTFDAFFRVKKITDHSIDNLRITSLTFNDVFDQAFFTRIKCNIRENLLNHIDGKLFNNEESESRISNFEKTQPEQQATENFGCEISLNAATPAPSLLTTQFGEDPESQIEYGSKASKKKTTPKKDEVHYKYFTRRKYQASILESKENRDLSKLDMWTQYVIKNRQQQIIEKTKSDKEKQEYKKGDEFKAKFQNDELNKILDRRGPFEDLKEEVSKKAALEGNFNPEAQSDVSCILEEILGDVFGNPAEDVEIKTELTDAEIPSYLNLRKATNESFIDRSDKITLICSSQETENFEAPEIAPRDKNSLVELTGEWARSRLYICAACGLKCETIRLLLDHKNCIHSNVWCQHYEFVGNQGKFYKHLSIPGLGKMDYLEANSTYKVWKRSEARTCTKCNKQCNSLGELHRHILECGEDWSWMLVRKKCKYRPFGAKTRKKRRGLFKRIINKEKVTSDVNREKKPCKKIEGPRVKPSDAETIQRMLANLPAKRATRKIMSLKDGFPKAKKTTKPDKEASLAHKTLSARTDLLVQESEKIMKRKLVVKAKTGMKCNPVGNRRKSMRNLNKVISSKVMDNSGALMVKRKLKNAMQQRKSRRAALSSSSQDQVVDETEQSTNSVVKTLKRSVIKEKFDFSEPAEPTSPVKKKVCTKNKIKDTLIRTLSLRKKKDDVEAGKPKEEATTTTKRKSKFEALKNVVKKMKFTKKSSKPPIIDNHFLEVESDVVAPDNEVAENDDKSDKSSDVHAPPTFPDPEEPKPSESKLFHGENRPEVKVEPIEIITKPPKQKPCKRPKGLNACIAMLTSKLQKDEWKTKDDDSSTPKLSEEEIAKPKVEQPSLEKVPSIADEVLKNVEPSELEQAKLENIQPIKVIEESFIATPTEEHQIKQDTILKSQEISLDNVVDIIKCMKNLKEPEITKQSQKIGSMRRRQPKQKAVEPIKDKLNDAILIEDNPIEPTNEPVRKIGQIREVPKRRTSIQEVKNKDLSVIREEPEGHLNSFEEDIELETKELPKLFETMFSLGPKQPFEVKKIPKPFEVKMVHCEYKKPKNFILEVPKRNSSWFSFANPTERPETNNVETFSSNSKVSELKSFFEAKSAPMVELKIPTVRRQFETAKQPVNWLLDNNQASSWSRINFDIKKSLTVADVLPLPVANVIPLPVTEVMPLPVANIIPLPVAKIIPLPIAEVIPLPVAEVTPLPVADAIPLPVANVVTLPVLENNRLLETHFDDISEPPSVKSIDENIESISDDVSDSENSVIIIDALNNLENNITENSECMIMENKSIYENFENIIKKIIPESSVMQSSCDISKNLNQKHTPTSSESKIINSSFENSESVALNKISEISQCFIMKQVPEYSETIPIKNISENLELQIDNKNLEDFEEDNPIISETIIARNVSEITEPTIENNLSEIAITNQPELIENKIEFELVKSDTDSEDELPLSVLAKVSKTEKKNEFVPEVSKDKSMYEAISVYDFDEAQDETRDVINHIVSDNSKENIEDEQSPKRNKKKTKKDTAELTPVENFLTPLKENKNMEVNSDSYLQTPDLDDSVILNKLSNKMKMKRGKKAKVVKKLENEPAESSYCDICNKKFVRADGLNKHKRTLTHIAKLSEIEAREAAEKAMLKELEQIEHVEPEKDEVQEQPIEELPTEIEEIPNDMYENLSEAEEPEPEMEEKLIEVEMEKVRIEGALISTPFPLNATTNDTLHLANIINDVLSSPEPTPELPKRCKSLGERKSFDSDSIYNQPSFTKIPNNLEHHLSILENIIEENQASFQYIDEISVSSNKSEQRCPSDMSLVSDIKPDDSNIITFTHNTNIVTSLMHTDGNFVKPTQYEEISEDTRTFEEQRARKALNRDEELFLECCSLLKSSSEVSNFSKKSSHAISLVNTYKPDDEWLEPKQQQSYPKDDFLSEDSCPNTPIGENYDDFSNSNTIKTDWNTKLKEQEFEDISMDSISNRSNSNFVSNGFNNCFDDDKNNDFSRESKEFDDTNTSSEFKRNIDAKFNGLIVEAMKNEQLVKELNRKPEVTQTSIIDYVIPLSKRIDSNDSLTNDSKKMLTKGAMKVFEGLKVSIPTEDLDMNEVLNCSPKSKRLEIESSEIMKEDKSKPKNNMKKFGNKLGLKVTKKRSSKVKKSQEEKEENKVHDIYDFEETQDNTDLFVPNNLTTFRKQNIDIKDPEVIDKDLVDTDTESNNHFIDSFSYEAPSVSSFSTETESSASINKGNGVQNITKKKCVIMGRIFKNAFKPKPDEIKDLEDTNDNYVISCPELEVPVPKVTPKRLTEAEMDLLFDKLLEDNLDGKQEPKVKTSCKNSVAASCTKKKRSRKLSESSDDDFNLGKNPKKRAARKRTKDDGINLEQELKECMGVAGRKSQRKCTSGKQNVLMEVWSSDDSDFELKMKRSLEQSAAEVKVIKEPPPKQVEHQQQPPIHPEVIQDIIKDANDAIKKRKKKSSSARTKSMSAAGSAESTLASNRRKRSAAETLYYWSSSSDDESQNMIEVKSLRDEDDDDRPMQHGWIVGDSPKKLVTMLAQAKGKKLDSAKCVKEQNKKRTTI